MTVDAGRRRSDATGGAAGGPNAPRDLDPRLGSVVAFIPVRGRIHFLRRLTLVVLALAVLDAVLLALIAILNGLTETAPLLVAGLVILAAFPCGYWVTRRFLPRYGLAVCEKGLWRDGGLGRFRTIFWPEIASFARTGSTLRIWLADPEAFDRARPRRGLNLRIRSRAEIAVPLSTYATPPARTAELIAQAFEARRIEATPAGGR